MRESQAVTGVMTAILIALFVAVLALVIDLGHLHGVRNELQNAADAAALAGARALVKIEDYPVVAAPDPPYCGTAFETARDAILENKSDGASLQMNLGATLDVTLGWWGWDPANAATFQKFTPYIYQYSEATGGNCSLSRINAVNVVVRRSDQADSAGPSVFTTFAKLFGWDSASVVASSTAAIGFSKEICAPFFMCLQYNTDPDSWFQKFINPETEGYVHLNADNRDTGAWAHESANPTPAELIPRLSGGPCVTVGDEVNLNNGTWGSMLQALDEAIHANWNTYTCGGNTYTGWLVPVCLISADKMNQSRDLIDDPDYNPQTGENGPLGPFMCIILHDVIHDPKDKDHPWSIQAAYFPCPCQVEGTPGAAESILATRPKLVQFDWYPSPP